MAATPRAGPTEVGEQRRRRDGARTITSNTYYDWLLDHVFILVPAQAGVAEFLETFQEFPPLQKAASFSVDQVMEKMKDSVGGGMH